jgi:hypothetical protein
VKGRTLGVGLRLKGRAGVATYLTISVGDRPQQAKPILASDDQRVIQAALDALLRRAGVVELSHRPAKGDRERDE